MNLLFIQGGSRWKYDSEGTLYTDPNFNSQIWRFYCFRIFLENIIEFFCQ